MLVHASENISQCTLRGGVLSSSTINSTFGLGVQLAQGIKPYHPLRFINDENSASHLSRGSLKITICQRLHARCAWESIPKHEAQSEHAWASFLLLFQQTYKQYRQVLQVGLQYGRQGWQPQLAISNDSNESGGLMMIYMMLPRK